MHYLSYVFLLVLLGTLGGFCYYFFQTKYESQSLLFIEKHCLQAHFDQCSNLNWNDEEIKNNGLDDCVIIKMAKQKCSTDAKMYTNMICLGSTCSIDCKNLENDPLSICFWSKDYFNISRDIFDQVKTNLNLNRYICIQQNGEKGIDLNSTCIKTSLLRGKNYDVLIEMPLVNDYLAQNLMSYTSLDARTAIKITNVPKDLAVYTRYGKKLESNFQGDVIVLPFPLKVTLELLSWMNSSLYFSHGICNALGLRKLDKKEEMEIANYHHHDCFYNENLEENKVFSFGKNVATTHNHATINLNITFKLRKVLFGKNEIAIPSDWSSLTDEIHFQNKLRYFFVSRQDLMDILYSQVLKVPYDFCVVCGVEKHFQVDKFLGFEHEIMEISNNINLPFNLILNNIYGRGIPETFYFAFKTTTTINGKYRNLPNDFERIICLKFFDKK